MSLRGRVALEAATGALDVEPDSGLSHFRADNADAA